MMLERERGGEDGKGRGGRAATCCVQLCSKVSPTSAEKLSRETMSTFRRGRALRRLHPRLQQPRLSLGVSAADAHVLPPPKCCFVSQSCQRALLSLSDTCHHPHLCVP